MVTNELIHETSPYLLQHAENPVAWMPWSAAAFERAKQEDKPIFLSVGYSTCHWCHVMAHESFENEEVADILNEHFISIKVDREELPDVDEQYMIASQLLTRRGGGWPNSVWLTPDRKPWFAGTYFPREDRGEMLGFKSLLLRLSEAWEQRRGEVESQAERMAEILQEIGTDRQAVMEEAEPRPLGAEIIDNAVETIVGTYDSIHGGFGVQPKFPPHGQLALLIHQHRKTQDSEPLGMVTKTLEAMSQGGIYDQIGGGFHRYSTDESWFLPHFEKMLYDNAQLIRAYANGYELTRNEDFKRVVRETVDWLTREMTDPAGGFYCALDADSKDEEGHAEEGRFYVWTPDQVIDVLGSEDGKFFNTVYGISHAGNFLEEATGQRTGYSIPFLELPIDDMATGMKFDRVEFRQRLHAMREKLLQRRAKRPRPHCDDKVLTGWNGLMIEGLAHAGRLLDDPAYIGIAERAADFISKKLRRGDGRLLRSWRDGQAKIHAYLDDYAFFIQGLLELHLATDESRWLTEAVDLAELMIFDFGDPVLGKFYLTSSWHDPLLVRSTGAIGGGNVPSANGVVASVLTRLAVLTENANYATTARELFEAYANTMWDQPGQSEHLVLALDEYLALEAQGKLPQLVHSE